MAKSILVVDDSDSVRTIVRIALRDAGYDVVEAGNGQEALGKLDGTRFSLVISDLNMPVMDGLTFLKQLRQHASCRFTPVIMLTTESGEEHKQEGRAAGAKAWVVKPFQPAVLVAAVTKLAAG